MRMRAKQCREQSASVEDAAARVLLEATADEWISVAELYDNLRMRVFKAHRARSYRLPAPFAPNAIATHLVRRRS
jgi:hypothetical protein